MMTTEGSPRQLPTGSGCTMATRFPSSEDLLAGGRFLSKLPSFLRHPMGLEEARTTLRRRLEHRETDFLALARFAIYDNPRSPYRELLALAGCEPEDLERLVRRDGVESALVELYRRGVYLSVDEFKGRSPIVRGNAVIHADPGRFGPPGARHHVPLQTGGSRGEGTRLSIDLAYVRDRAVDAGLVFHAMGGDRWIHGVWGVPGAAQIVILLELSAFGATVSRWFSQLDPGSPGLHARYRWSAHALRLSSSRPGLDHPSAHDSEPRETLCRWHDLPRHRRRPGARGSAASTFRRRPHGSPARRAGDEDGRPQLRLLVHPALGTLDPAAVPRGNQSESGRRGGHGSRVARCRAAPRRAQRPTGHGRGKDPPLARRARG